MSKTALKKELGMYSKEQLIEVVLDLYSSRSEVKDYFKFFLNPDSKALFEKYQKGVNKEMSRTKRSMSRARISVIKKLVKDFRGYQPETAYIYRLYEHIVSSGLYNEHYYFFTETLMNGICNLVIDYLEYADSNGELDTALKSIDVIVTEGAFGRRLFKSRISDACRTYINRKSI